MAERSLALIRSAIQDCQACFRAAAAFLTVGRSKHAPATGFLTPTIRAFGYRQGHRRDRVRNPADESLDGAKIPGDHASGVGDNAGAIRHAINSWAATPG